MEVGMFFKLESPKLQTLSIFGHGEKAGRVLGGGGFVNTFHAPHLELMLKCCLKLINAINKKWRAGCQGPFLT